MFWPALDYSYVNMRLDAYGYPNVVQLYHVPAPADDMYHLHDAALYSTWNHFIEFCQLNSDGFFLSDSKERVNRFSKKVRLPVFMKLSNFEARLSDALILDMSRVKLMPVLRAVVSPLTTEPDDDFQFLSDIDDSDIDDSRLSPLFNSVSIKSKPLLASAKSFVPINDFHGLSQVNHDVVSNKSTRYDMACRSESVTTASTVVRSLSANTRLDDRTKSFPFNDWDIADADLVLLNYYNSFDKDLLRG